MQFGYYISMNVGQFIHHHQPRQFGFTGPNSAFVKFIDKLRITPVPASAGVELGTAQPQLVSSYMGSYQL